jgi:phage-related protein
MVIDRPLCWLGSSLEDLRDFPADYGREAGYQLARVQRGLMLRDWKPMTSVGIGVQEIRIDTGTEHRVFHVANFRDAVYVLHAFEKRTRRTPRVAIELARRRLADLRRDRSRQEE